MNLALPESGSIELEIKGRSVRLTSLEKVLWPGAGFTKRDLIAYYAGVSELILPELEDRALTLGRWPGGLRGRGFAQTECRGRPSWLRTATVRLASGETRQQCLIDHPAALVWVANQNAIELHAPLHRVSEPERPSSMLFDLDPASNADPLDAPRVAGLLRELLGENGFESQLRSSGSTGLHVVVPWAARGGYPESKSTARALATELSQRHPELASVSARTRDRRGSVFIDWAQNDPGRTSVVTYSLRAVDPPRVAAPILWQRLERALEAGSAEPLSISPDMLIRLRRQAPFSLT